MEDLEQAPPKFKDTQPQVHDPMEEVNLNIVEEPRITYNSSLLPSNFKEGIIATLQVFNDCFSWNYDKMPESYISLVEHRLPIKPEFHPFQQPPRIMSKEIKPKVKKKIENLLKAKFIIPTRYVQWLANIVPLKKKNEKLRVYVDFRDLNDDTPKDMYVMSIADMLVDSTRNNELFSFMDGFSRYNQILIVVDDISKTAFGCPSSLGTFEWLVMPFGLKNSSVTYQRAMNAIFDDILGHHMVIYIDDIVVKSKRVTEHVNRLSKSFERMRLHQLKLNPLKCAFGVQAGNFLGFLVHQKRVEVDQNKAKAIISSKAPKNKKELQKLLGQVNYVRRFISNLVGKTKKFSNLIKLKEVEEFKWDKKHQIAFHGIKCYLSKPHVLMSLSKGRPLKLYL